MSRRIPIGSADEFAPGENKLVFIDRRGVVLFNIRGALRTVENACPHNEASPADGQLEGGAASLPCARPSF